MSYNLTVLGWGSHFAQSLQSHEGSGLVPGRVGREDRERYVALTEMGEVPARLSGSYRHRVDGWDEFPCVGDWVLLRPSPHEGEAMIQTLLPRRTEFKRKAVLSGRTEMQVLAANIDTVFLVSGLDGDFNPRRVERYLAIAWDGGATPVLLLNKADLCEDVDGAVAEIQNSALGVAIHVVSGLLGEGLELLHPYLGVGKTVAFLGSSGVGKSTIINRLLGEERQYVQDVRAHDSRGRHTTVARELILMPGGGVLIDTPGLRQVPLWSDEGGVSTVFHEVEELAPSCRFRDCQHQGEPGCAVHHAIDDGRLDPARLRSYRKLKREEAFFARRREQRARMGAKERRRGRKT